MLSRTTVLIVHTPFKVIMLQVKKFWLQSVLFCQCLSSMFVMSACGWGGTRLVRHKQIQFMGSTRSAFPKQNLLLWLLRQWLLLGVIVDPNPFAQKVSFQEVANHETFLLPCKSFSTRRNCNSVYCSPLCGCFCLPCSRGPETLHWFWFALSRFMRSLHQDTWILRVVHQVSAQFLPGVFQGRLKIGAWSPWCLIT